MAGGGVWSIQISRTAIPPRAPEIIDNEDCLLYKDLDGNGEVDIDDLAAHITLWLANCQ